MDRTDIPDREIEGCNEPGESPPPSPAHDPFVSRRIVLGILGTSSLAAGIISYWCDTGMKEEAKKYATYAKSNKEKAFGYWKLAQNNRADMRKTAQYIQLMRAELQLYRINSTYASKPYLYPVQQTLPDVAALSDRELLDGTGIQLDEFQTIAESVAEEIKKLAME